MATKKKKRMGRPPKPPSERRDRYITMRLTAEEYAACEKAAGDFPVHTWARVVMLRAAGVDPKARKKK